MLVFLCLCLILCLFCFARKISLIRKREFLSWVIFVVPFLCDYTLHRVPLYFRNKLNLGWKYYEIKIGNITPVFVHQQHNRISARQYNESHRFRGFHTPVSWFRGNCFPTAPHLTEPELKSSHTSIMASIQSGVLHPPTAHE